MNLARLVENSSCAVKHVTGSTMAGWEGTGVVLGRKPFCAHCLLESSRKAEGNAQPRLDPCHRFGCLMLSMFYCCFSLSASRKAVCSCAGG